MSFEISFDLPPDWQVKTVQELVNEKILEKPLDGNHGGIHPKASDYVETGIPFIMASDLEAGLVNFSSCKYISLQQAEKLRKGFAREGDVLLSHKATIGRTAIVQPNDSEYIVLTPQVTYYRVKDENKLNNIYLKSFFDSYFFQTILNQWAGSGSTRAYLGITEQLKLPVIVPPIDSQIEIASFTNNLNSKIHLNNKINQTLESIAQAIFKSWFIDFEPVRAKIAAKQEGNDSELAAMCVISGKSEVELQQMAKEDFAELQATAALFPDELVENELGEVPKGWSKTDLSILADLNVQSWSKKNHPKNIKYVDLSNTKKGVIQQTEEFLFEEAPSRARRVLKVGDTIVGTVRPANGSYAFIQQDSLTGSTGFAVLTPKKDVYAEFIYIASIDEENIKRLAHLADGGAYPAVNYDTVLNTPCILPIENKDGILNLFHKNVKEFYLLSASKFEENNILASIRDTLLPKLLSGEIDVSLLNRAQV